MGRGLTVRGGGDLTLKGREGGEGERTGEERRGEERMETKQGEEEEE